MKNKAPHFICCFVLATSFLVVSFAFAETYYVRPDGGNTSQCTGLTDASYPGSGTNQACAFSHPYYVIAPVGNNPTLMEGGDTLIIDGSNNAEYMLGYGSPNARDTTKCYKAWPWDCYMRSIPSGPSPSNPTRILGKGWDQGCENPPQLWGTQRVSMVLNLVGSSNVEIQCVEVTDHSACQEHGPNACERSTYPYGEWAESGVVARDSSNVLLRDVNIHGLAYRGVYAGRLSDWTLENTQIVANSFVGWDGDIGAFQSSNSGTMMFDNVDILYSGCGETYPGGAPYNCYSQDQGGYGDGLGTHSTGGDWIFQDCDISHNVSDGLDLLYHNGNGSVSIKRSRFEGNAGNQVKAGAETEIENSVIIGNCAYFKDKDIDWDPSTFNHCRAGGNSVAIAFHTGMSASIINSTITSNGDVMVQSSGQSCDGTETFYSRNNIFFGGTEFNSGAESSALYYPAGKTGNSDGPCGSIAFDDDYSLIYNTKYQTTVCDGKPHSICADPEFEEPHVQYYEGDAFRAYLKSNSPARDKAMVLVGKSSLDYNYFNRGVSWDIGALEYGSVPTQTPVTQKTCADDIAYCTTQQDCIDQSHYWYDAVCHADPETSGITCADWYEYCLTESDCTDQGHHWYNNICNTEPEEEEPTCAKDISYCTTQQDCIDQHFYWYNSTCHEKAYVPTCAQDGIEYCNLQSDCEAEGYFWYDEVCHKEAYVSTCADGIEYCVNQLDCLEQDYYWYGDACHKNAYVSTCADGSQYCGSAEECAKANYYWYDDQCHEKAYEPTCAADGIEYCTTEVECEGYGHHWYDDQCHEKVYVPSCAKDGIDYCTTEVECEVNGHHWYDAACHEKAYVPTCADSIEYCVVEQDCRDQKYYWYEGSCHEQAMPTCAQDISYCQTELACENIGYYWYGDGCHEESYIPTCATDGVAYCTTEVACEFNGYHWYNEDCHEKAYIPTCAADGIEYCTTENDCQTNGYYWYGGACHENAYEPTCAADGIKYCATENDCQTNGYYWYGGACHESAYVPTCAADGIEYCTTEAACEGNGHYWYDNACHQQAQPELTCLDGAQYCTTPASCNNMGYHWYDNACHEQDKKASSSVTTETQTIATIVSDLENPEEVVETEPEPTCEENSVYCKTKKACTSLGYYWYDNACHLEVDPTSNSNRWSAWKDLIKKRWSHLFPWIQ